MMGNGDPFMLRTNDTRMCVNEKDIWGDHTHNNEWTHWIEGLLDSDDPIMWLVDVEKQRIGKVYVKNLLFVRDYVDLNGWTLCIENLS